MAKRPDLGDVVEISTPKGFAYAQFIHDDARFGEMIRVLPGTFKTRPADLANLVAGPEKFIVFYAIRAAIRQRLVERVGPEPIPDRLRQVPPVLVAGATGRYDYTRTSFSVWDGERETHLRELRREHRTLPIAMSLGHPGLTNAIVNDWLPSDELLPGGVVGLRKLLGREPPTLGPRTGLTSHLVTAFWYAASEASARAAAAEAESAGYQTTVEMGDEDPPRWRLVARRNLGSASGLDEVNAFFDELADRFQGEYDGNEVTLDTGSE